MRIILKRTSQLLLCALWGGISVAEARFDLIPGSRYMSARAAALGDAFLPFGEDAASGLFYNPAGLAKIRKREIDLVNFTVSGNSGYADLVDMNFYKVTQLSNFTSRLNSQVGTLSNVGGSYVASVGLPGFSFGLLAQSQLAAQANSDQTYSVRSLYQLIPALGTGFRLFNGAIRVGYSLQWVNQALGQKTISDPSIGYSGLLKQGSGLSHTAGIAVTLPMRGLPSLNFVARNLFGTRYSSYSVVPFSNSSVGSPDFEPATYDASASTQVKLGQGAILNLAAVQRDLSNQSGTPTIARLALGGEFSFSNQIFVRMGYGTGYPAAGIGLKGKKAEFDLSWSSEELGSSYHSIRDIRYLVQYRVFAL